MSGKKNTPEMRKKPIWKNIYINSREASKLSKTKHGMPNKGPSLLLFRTLY